MKNNLLLAFFTVVLLFASCVKNDLQETQENPTQIQANTTEADPLVGAIVSDMVRSAEYQKFVEKTTDYLVSLNDGMPDAFKQRPDSLFLILSNTAKGQNLEQTEALLKSLGFTEIDKSMAAMSEVNDLATKLKVQFEPRISQLSKEQIKLFSTMMVSSQEEQFSKMVSERDCCQIWKNNLMLCLNSVGVYIGNLWGFWGLGNGIGLGIFLLTQGSPFSQYEKAMACINRAKEVYSPCCTNP